MPTSPEIVIPAARSVLPGTEIDFQGDSIRFKTLLAPAVFTIVNPILDRIVTLELDGVFAVTLPAAVDVINGDYCPDLGTNYLYLHCIDDVAPAYNCVWGVRV